MKQFIDANQLLGQKDNAKLGAHEFVLMFVPIEGALALAMRDNDGLFQYAWERRVAIVGPTSLLMTLKVVSAIWRYQRQGENATQIAQRRFDIRQACRRR
jgi:DNA recombination protein RmuC